MPLRGAVPVVLMLVACAHPSARTDTARPQPNATSATATPAPAPGANAASAGPRVDFARDVQPILLSRCQPCHFPGGTMYERRPFDRAATVRELGTKLFTRIKDEHERDVIRQFLAQTE